MLTTGNKTTTVGVTRGETKKENQTPRKHQTTIAALPPLLLCHRWVSSPLSLFRSPWHMADYHPTRLTPPQLNFFATPPATDATLNNQLNLPALCLTANYSHLYQCCFFRSCGSQRKRENEHENRSWSLIPLISSQQQVQVTVSACGCMIV